MLQGVLNHELKMSKTINRYLDLCLKCGACTKFCPSGIDIVDVVIAAKYEYFRAHDIEKLKTFFQKYFVFGLIPRFVRTFVRPAKSKKFNQKVLYFGGCGSKLKGDKAVVKVLNSINVEVINPLFHCCGVPYFSRGDLNEFNNSIKSYISILKKYNIREVITTCASCEKSLKEYYKWAAKEISNEDLEILKSVKVKNIYEYLRENETTLKLNRNTKITYHKPCNMGNFDDVLWLLHNTKNLEYVEMDAFNSCCGLNGLSKLKEFKIMKNIYSAKRISIANTKVKNVTTSCLGCEVALNAYSFGQYKVVDLIEFIAKNL